MPKSNAKFKRKKSWLPANSRLKYTLIGAFILIVGIVGYIAIRQTFAYTSMFKYYSQKDSRWANKPYPYIPGTRDQSDIALSRSGCGPTSMAMVASTLKKTVTPYDIGQWYGPRFHTSDGTMQSVYATFARDFGLRYSSLGNFHDRGTRSAIQNKLKSGNTLVIIHASKPSIFTRSGHIIVMRQYSVGRGAYLIADPNNSANNRWFSARELLDQANLQNAYSFTR